MNNSTENYSLELRLRITGFECSPKEIVKIIGVEPTKLSVKGQPFSDRTKAVSKQNAWRLDSPASGTNSSVAEQIRALEQVLNPFVDRFNNLPKESKVKLSMVVYAYRYFPPIYFSLEDLEFIIKIGASLEFDIYDLVEEAGDSAESPTQPSQKFSSESQ